MNKDLKLFLLFLLIYLSLYSQYFAFEATSEKADQYATFSFIMISFIMMVVPVILRIRNKEPFEFVEGRKICMINSWVLFGISLLTSVTIQISFIYPLGAIVYYFINMAVISKPKVNKQKKYPKENENNLKKLYNKMDPELITLVFPGKYNQFKNAVISLEKLTCEFHKRRDITRMYSGIVSGFLMEQKNDLIKARMLVDFPQLVNKDNIDLILAFVRLNMKEPNFSIRDTEDYYALYLSIESSEQQKRM